MHKKVIFTLLIFLLFLAGVQTCFSIQPPEAYFTYSPLEPYPNTTVTFNASESYDPDGYIVSYKWNFGDDTPEIVETDPITTHSFTQSGTYILTLNITDNEGLWCTTTKPINVLALLNVTATSDKTTYNLGENVQVSGNLTLGSVPVPDGLVGLQIDNAKNEFFILRTLPTGATPPSNPLVVILEVLPCDSYLNPKYVFQRGKAAYFKVTFKSNDNVSRSVVATLNIFDVNNVPFFASILVIMEVSPGSTSWASTDVLIPDLASLGNATVYASLFDKLPENGGTPYCPEKSATFTISAAGGGASTTITSASKTVYSTSTEGTYSLLFRLPSTEGYRAPAGNYPVNSTSRYLDRPIATNSTAFAIIFQGDINGDGVVNILDAILLAKAFGSRPGDSNWDPRADLNKDNVVNILDAIILSLNFGKRTG